MMVQEETSGDSFLLAESSSGDHEFRNCVTPDKSCWDILIWTSLPDSHALEHLGIGVEREHGGAAHTRTVQEAQRQTLHEGQR